MAAILFELVLGIVVGKALARGAFGASHEAAPASSAVLAVAGNAG